MDSKGFWRYLKRKARVEGRNLTSKNAAVPCGIHLVIYSSRRSGTGKNADDPSVTGTRLGAGVTLYPLLYKRGHRSKI
jgi:hypothetical protein